MNDLATVPDTASPRLNSNRISNWRKTKDRLATHTITAGGLGVLVAILMIFFYLLYEILPLFQSASLEKAHAYNLDTQGSALYLGMEEQSEVATRVSDSGQLLFFKAQSGEVLEQDMLPVAGPVTAAGLNSEQQPLLALGGEDGAVLLINIDYKVSFPNDQRLITPVLVYPYGEERMPLTDQPLRTLAVRDTDDALLLVGAAGHRLVGKRFAKEEDFLTEEVVLEEESVSLPDIDISADWLLIGPDQRWLYVISKSGDYRVIDLRAEALVDNGRLLKSGDVTAVRFLLGGISVMVGDSKGVVSQWFMVSESGQKPRLERIRDFKAEDQPIDNLIVEHRRKGFLTLSEGDTLDVFYSTSARHLLSQPLDAERAVISAAIAPRANAVLTEEQGGRFEYWQLHNEHPEVSWSALWSKVWYESYPEPDYIWQSSAANNDFEPKYSFTPLAFGTLKAAFYAMLLATPLAICGAIYTAYFMSPVLRRKIKPLIELMEALPTVILGFLAGLWLAPFVERNLPGVFAVFLLMPVGVLLFGYLWSQMPDRIRQAVPDGWHPVLMVPVVILVVWGSVMASGQMELWFFHGDMRAWLTHDLGISFDQRNSLVVGVAMGFAVIPTIFSIAEDAIFSVPKSLSYGSLALGATQWQSLVGVVIPTASPGIFSALMIGMGRAVGETMIVLMATGNTPIMDVNIFEGMRTLAANIAVEIGETEVDSSHFRVLFLAAFVLFMFTFLVNTAAEIVRQRLRKKYSSL